MDNNPGVYKVQFETQLPIDIHEALCRAIHERDLNALDELYVAVTDIQLEEEETGHDET